jgi:ribosomal protein L24E
MRIQTMLFSRKLVFIGYFGVSILMFDRLVSLLTSNSGPSVDVSNSYQSREDHGRNPMDMGWTETSPCESKQANRERKIPMLFSRKLVFIGYFGVSILMFDRLVSLLTSSYQSREDHGRNPMDMGWTETSPCESKQANRQQRGCKIREKDPDALQPEARLYWLLWSKYSHV